MKCTRCKSLRIVDFVDGFGKERIFCKSCWGSFPVSSFVQQGDQKKLHQYKIGTYNNIISELR